MVRRRLGRLALIFVIGLGVAGGCGSRSPAGPGSNRDGQADSGDDRPASGDSATDFAGEAAGDAVAEGSPEAITDTVRDTLTEGIADIPISGGDVAMDLPRDNGVDRVSMPCVAPGSCDPFDPAACGAQRCEPQLDGNYMCAGTKGTKMVGEACVTRTECAGGLDCVRIADDPATTCQRMCPRGALGACGAEQRCTNFIVGCVQYCRPRPRPCDPYAQNCPDPADACTLVTDTETNELYTGCRKAGTAAHGDRCDGAAICGKGLLCVREATGALCRQICTGDGGARPCVTGNCTGITSTTRITYCQG